MSDDALEAEFDTVADWTEQAIRELGRDHAIPGACRGSGYPPELAWLAAGLDLRGDARFLDTGAGLGGPSAWLAEHLGDRWSGTPVLTDPMAGAAAAARRLFGFPSLAAWSERMPLRDDSVDAAWALGVLCTTDAKRELLDEVHRVLRPGGRCSLLVLVARADPLPEAPDGNVFPTDSSLRADLAAAGFRIDAAIEGDDAPGSVPEGWTERADAVARVVTRDHGGEDAWREAEHQQEVMGRLIGGRHVVTTLLHTTAV